jgi:hypothetical protein
MNLAPFQLSTANFQNGMFPVGGNKFWSMELTVFYPVRGDIGS